jgi:hypothetical protein
MSSWKYNRRSDSRGLEHCLDRQIAEIYYFNSDDQTVNFQLLFGSAEDVFCKRFLAAMKKQNTPLYENLAAVIEFFTNMQRLQTVSEYNWGSRCNLILTPAHTSDNWVPTTPARFELFKSQKVLCTYRDPVVNNKGK